MKHTRTILTICAVVLLLASCHPLRKTAASLVSDTSELRDAPTPPNSELRTPNSELTEVQKRTLTAMNFTATVDGINVSGQVRQAEDSVIWVTVSKFIELGRAKATVDSVWVNVPLAGRHFAGTYAEASRVAKHEVSFCKLQSILNAPDATKQIEALAATLGFDATVTLGQRLKKEQLTFPL